MRRAVVSLVCAAALLTACRQEEPNPTEPPATGAGPASTAAPESAIPTTQPVTSTTLNLSVQPTAAQLQDPAYWNAILAALHKVVGDAFRKVVSTKVVDPPTVEALRQIYGTEVFSNEREAIVEVAAGRATGVIDPPGDVIATRTAIVKASARCVALTASLDFAKVNSRVPVSEVAMELRPREKIQNPLNPTPWMIEQRFMIKTPEDMGFLCTD